MASSIENMTVVDCGVCESPLKPPIFQCEVGHMVCSECSEKMAAAGGCGAEHIVECFKVPCPNKEYGCSVMLARYDQSAHLQACEYRPFHCPAGDCLFVTGGLPALRDHFVKTHIWPSTSVFDELHWSTNLALVDGFNLIEINPYSYSFSGEMELNPSGLVLVKMTRESYGRVVTPVYITPRHSCGLKLAFETPCGTHRLEYAFKVASTDLSASGAGAGGPSSLDGCFQFVVPKSIQPLDVDTIKVAFTCDLDHPDCSLDGYYDFGTKD